MDGTDDAPPTTERIKNVFAEVTSIDEVRSLTEAALDAKVSPAEVLQSMSN